MFLHMKCRWRSCVVLSPIVTRVSGSRLHLQPMCPDVILARVHVLLYLFVVDLYGSFLDGLRYSPMSFGVGSSPIRSLTVVLRSSTASARRAVSGEVMSLKAPSTASTSQSSAAIGMTRHPCFLAPYRKSFEALVGTLRAACCFHLVLPHASSASLGTSFPF